MKQKFSVGDVVRGTAGRYAVTNHKMIEGLVVYVDEEQETISIDIVEHLDGKRGRFPGLDPEWFIYVRSSYKPGDMVEIVSVRTAGNWNPGMDKWLGQTMTIEHIGARHCGMVEDDGRWFWHYDMIADYAEHDTDLEPASESELLSFLFTE